MAHPMSGAGRIKFDASNDERLVEMKDARQSHTVQLSTIRALHSSAARQGKRPEYIVYFEDGYVLRGTVERR